MTTVVMHNVVSLDGFLATVGRPPRNPGQQHQKLTELTYNPYVPPQVS
ncbi:hypothetical protein [Streptomyces collinus]